MDKQRNESVKESEAVEEIFSAGERSDGGAKEIG